MTAPMVAAIKYRDGPFWPDVLAEALDAPYRPAMSDEHRRILAIADGLTCWGSCHLAEPPPQFGDAVMKLGRIAEIAGLPDGDAFMAASKGLGV